MFLIHFYVEGDGEVKKIFIAILFAVTTLLITTGSVAAATRITWRTGSGSFSTYITSPNFYVGRVDGRSQAQGINEIDAKYSCSHKTAFSVKLYTSGGRYVSSTPNATCTPNGGIYNSFGAWLAVKSTGHYHIRFSKISGTGTIKITSYKYYYYKP
jgi:hypothetical protein